MTHIDGNTKITPQLARQALYRIEGMIASEDGMIIENALTIWEEERSGTFDLIPTDVDVEGLTWEDLPQIRIKLRDDKHVSASEILALVNAVGTLWSELAEKESEAKANLEYADQWHDSELKAQIKLNQTIESLEEIESDLISGHPKWALDTTRKALQSIRGEPHDHT